jgi:hypothetical protein
MAANDFAGRPKPESTVDLITIDANLLHDYWKARPRMSIVEQLLDLAAERRVDAVVTRYIHDDIPHKPLSDRLNELPALNVGMTGGLFTVGYSANGGSDFLGSDGFLRCQELLSGTWRPSRGKAPDQRDWNHLHAHYAKRRDYFLTWDEPLRELGALLATGFPIRVIAPDDYLRSRAAGSHG